MPQLNLVQRYISLFAAVILFGSALERANAYEGWTFQFAIGLLFLLLSLSGSMREMFAPQSIRLPGWRRRSAMRSLNRISHKFTDVPVWPLIYKMTKGLIYKIDPEGLGAFNAEDKTNDILITQVIYNICRDDYFEQTYHSGQMNYAHVGGGYIVIAWRSLKILHDSGFMDDDEYKEEVKSMTAQYASAPSPAP